MLFHVQLKVEHIGGSNSPSCQMRLSSVVQVPFFLESYLFVRGLDSLVCKYDVLLGFG